MSGLSASRDAGANDTDRCVSDAEQAQRLRHDGHLRSARDSLVACARETCPGPVRVDCKKWLGEVDADLPSIVLRASEDDGRALMDVRVLIDGAVLVERLDGRAVSVDPGAHVLRYERADKTAVEQHVLVNQGEHGRLVSAAFPTPNARASGTSTTMPWLVGAAGAVVAGGGAYLWIKGRSDRSALYSTCGLTASCLPADVTAAKTKLVVGDVGVAVGVVTMGIAAVWLVMIGSKKDAGSRVDASVTPGGGFVSYRAAF